MKNDDKLKRKKEYYFRRYFNQSDLIQKRREIIEELNLTKKEIIENPVYLGAINYDSMPHNPNVNPDAILDKIIKVNDRIEIIDNRIIEQVRQLNRDLMIFENIDNMLHELTERQYEVFMCTYKNNMTNKEIEYKLDITDKTIQNARRVIFRKSDFIQED